VRDREFDSVVQMARASMLWRVVSWLIEGWRLAWASSTTVRTARHARSAISMWPPELRLRFAALTIAWAGLGYAASSFLLPRYVISGLPVAWTAIVVLAALVVAAMPGAFALAWDAKFRK
jgi:hypothetical protein